NNNNANARYVFVWIDWDGNGDFETDERLSVANTSSTGLVILNGSITVPGTGDAVTGATRMRVQFIRNSNPVSTSTNNGESEDYTVILTTEGWKGQNNVWNVAQNWTSGSVPDLNTDVYIPENPLYGKVFPTITGTALMKNLEIANNASLNINPGALVTINGDITINGDLIVENTTTQPASVITDPTKTITGNVTVRWTYPADHWWFTGHSISNPAISTYTNIRVNDNTNSYALYEYSDAGKLVRTSAFITDPLSGERIRGFQFKVKKELTLEHVGLLNNQASYSKALLDGWQIIANPYPAYYKLPEVGDDTGDFGATEGTVYVSNSATNATKYFDTYNVFSGLTSPETFDGIIAPNQAFYIKTKDSEYGTGKMLTMDAANRTNVGSKPTLKSGNSNKNVLRLHLRNEHDLLDEAVIALFPDGETRVTESDSEQRMYSGTNYSYIYSIVEGTKLVINVLPDELVNYKQQLGIQAREGKQYLKITGVEALKVDYEIVLEDKKLETLTTMNSSVTYEFDSEEGVDHDRFVLHFKTKGIDVPTDIDDVEGQNRDVEVYIQNHSTLSVKCEWDMKEKNVEVYTVSGSLVMNKVFEGNTYTDELNVQPGIYIVKVSGGNHSYQQKVFVK
ncbi:MAG: T9SS type A sorting domain-containing protein, partial [Bacteroidales bacterium]|nr:T9SS type A sorting domain-containing protein [Bacteroidales bacterium]